MQTRTGSRSGSSQFVVHAVYIHTHHTAMNSIVTRTRLSNVSSASSVCESCVTANTKTRSKNNSTMPTRPLPARVRSRNNAVTEHSPGDWGEFYCRASRRVRASSRPLEPSASSAGL